MKLSLFIHQTIILPSIILLVSHSPVSLWKVILFASMAPMFTVLQV